VRPAAGNAHARPKTSSHYLTSTSEIARARWRSSVPLTSASWRSFAPETPNEKDHRSDRWSQKPQRLFVGNCLALRRQLTARRLAGCCRIDARFTLAFWTLAPWTLAFGHWSRRTLVAIGTGRFRRSSFSARDGARDPLDQPSIIQQPIRRIVQMTIKCSSMKFRSPWLSRHQGVDPFAIAKTLEIGRASVYRAKANAHSHRVRDC